MTPPAWIPACLSLAAAFLDPSSAARFWWGDWNGDGLLDAVVQAPGCAPKLVQNCGEGSFIDVSETAGWPLLAKLEQVAFADFDGDLETELVLVANGRVRLFGQSGATLVEQTDLAGLASLAGVSGLCTLDVDGDGGLELWLTWPEGERVLRRTAGGAFEDLDLGLLFAPIPGEAPPTLRPADDGVGAGRAEPGEESYDRGGVRVTRADRGGRRAGSDLRGDPEEGAMPAVQGPTISSASVPPLNMLGCASSIKDQDDPGSCLQASTVPTLGWLHPLSLDLNVSAAGNVGIGTAAPATKLEVAGAARVGGTLTLAPSDDRALDVSGGSLYKEGVLFLHSKGGINNTALGRRALTNVTTGHSNTVTGANALYGTTSGFENTASGHEALFSNTTGSGNTASGANALRTNASGSYNTAIGEDALLLNTSGVNNVASGADALYSNTSGGNNTASGVWSLRFNTSGSQNTASGFGALRANTIGNFNTASGSFAAYSNTTGSFNTANGHKALFSNTTGFENTASGREALLSNTAGVRNTASGADALRTNTTGNGNTACGSDALFSNTSADDNTALGTGALRSNTVGQENTACGAGALYSNVNGNYNSAFGQDALRANTFGDYNTACGDNALSRNTTGNYNTALGKGALDSNTIGEDNVACGYAALSKNTAGSGNTACGTRSLFGNTTGGSNTGLGYEALRVNSTGNANTAIGDRALTLNSTGHGNTATGAQALLISMTGDYNTAHGHRALRSNLTGFQNTASGADALNLNTNGFINTAFGFSALSSNTTGSGNTALGFKAGYNLTTGSNNIDIGHLGTAGESATIRIGTGGTQTRAFIAGIRGATTGVANAIPVLVDSNGQLGTVSSSRRFKEEIRDMGDATERLLELRPVVFRYKPEVQEGQRPLEYGLIAEEVAEVFPDLVVYDQEGQPFTVKYHLLASMLLNELKQQRAVHASEIEGLKSRLAAVEAWTAPSTPVMASR